MPAPEGRAAREAATDIAALRDWVVSCGLMGRDYAQMLEELCHKLDAMGVPLLRMNLSMRAHHPEIGAFAYRWKREAGMMREVYMRDPDAVTGWDQSPLKVLVEGPDFEMHRPVRAPYEFPMFEEIAAQGATDYFAQQQPFGEEGTEIDTTRVGLLGLMVSWAADAPGGFGARDLEIFRALLPVLALALKSKSNFQTAADLLRTYLGQDASLRVMSGEIARGTVRKLDTAILYFDLQGFTKLSEALPPEKVTDLLNDYFGDVVDIVEAHDGTVLKFMGDGLLAIFPEMGAGESRLAALDSVAAIAGAVSAVSERRAAAGDAVTDFAAALHAGEVLYGNIGGKTRLDFTVIGPAVNAAARISAMCSALDQRILVSANIARPALEARPALVSLGQYRLRGVSERVELFTLD